MENTTNTGIRLSYRTLIWIGVGLIIILFLLWDGNCSQKIEDTTSGKIFYNYTTDSIYKKEYFALKAKWDKRNTMFTPPLIITEYLPLPSRKIDSIKIINEAIAFYLDTVKKPLMVNKEFIINYVEAPKLLEFNLIKDTLSLTTFSKDAKTLTHKWPLYLNEFGYAYYDNDLHRYNIKSEPPKKQSFLKDMKWNQVYVNSGYEFTQEAPLLGVEYNLNPGRFKIDANADVILLKQPNLNLNVKLGYRLFK